MRDCSVGEFNVHVHCCMWAARLFASETQQACARWRDESVRFENCLAALALVMVLIAESNPY